MKIDLKRDARQDESTDKWNNNKGIGCIYACPGFGKTRVGVKIIDKCRSKRPVMNILILTPSEIVEKNWINQQLYGINIVTSNRAKNNLVKILENKIDLLIVDELHKFTSDDNIDLISILCKNSIYRLGLTGTYPDNNKIKSLFPIVDTISEQEAIENGWISDFIEYNIPLSLNDNEMFKYIKYSEHISETMELFKGKHKVINEGTNLFDSDFDLILSCFVGKRVKGNINYVPSYIIRDLVAKSMGWHRELNLSNNQNRQIDMYWRPENIYERAKIFKKFVNDRNEILINNKAKLYCLLDIIKKNDVPTIIYNGSIEFANTIAECLGDKAILYHSKLKSRPMIDDNGEIIKFSTGKVKMFGIKKIKDEAINGMQSGKYKYLVTVEALDEGLDLPELEQVIITSGSTNPLQQFQRSSRSKRIDQNNSLKFSRIFNLYIDDFRDSLQTLIISRDKSKLIQRQKNYSHSVKWLNNLSEVTL